MLVDISILSWVNPKNVSQPSGPSEVCFRASEGTSLGPDVDRLDISEVQNKHLSIYSIYIHKCIELVYIWVWINTY